MGCLICCGNAADFVRHPHCVTMGCRPAAFADHCLPCFRGCLGDGCHWYPTRRCSESVPLDTWTRKRRFLSNGFIWWPGAESNHRHADFQSALVDCIVCLSTCYRGARCPICRTKHYCAELAYAKLTHWRSVGRLIRQVNQLPPVSIHAKSFVHKGQTGIRKTVLTLSCLIRCALWRADFSRSMGSAAPLKV